MTSPADDTPAEGVDKSRLTRLVEHNLKQASTIHNQLREQSKLVKCYEDDLSRLKEVTDNTVATNAISEQSAHDLIASLEADRRHLDRFVSVKGPETVAALMPIATSGVTGAMSIVTATFLDVSPPNAPAGPIFRAFQEKQSQADNARGIRQLCVDHIHRLRCDSGFGVLSASNTTLLQQAWGSFENPPHGPHGSLAPLIAMRECLDNTIESLKRRLPPPNVPGSKGDVVRAVVRKARRAGIGEQEGESLANELTLLKSQLSNEGKQGGQPRPATLMRLSAATNWLQRFLNAIDETQLRAE